MPARPTPPASAARLSEPALPLHGLSTMLFASGAVALVYEVTWQRQLADTFGSAASATAAVLAAYFAGLGIGAVLGGQLAPRIRRPLRAYAAAEALIGLGALLVAPLLSFAEGFTASAFAHGDDGSSGALLAWRVLAAFAVLALPTLAMGATLPLLARLLETSREAGSALTRLYLVNTAGAALGALALPFALLPWLGIRGSVTLGAAINLLLAAFAWWLDRVRDRATVKSGAEGNDEGAVNAVVEATRRPPGKRGRNAESGGMTESEASATAQPASIPPATALAIAFLSGAFTFALQVLWNRAFAQVHENSMHAFALIVALVILALAGGAQLARRTLARGIAARRLIGCAWSIAGLFSLLGPVLFLRWTDGLRYLPEGGSQLARWGKLTALATGTVLPPMLLLGVALPALLDETSRRSAAAVTRSVSHLLLANVAGAVTGALFAGLLLPSWVGLWWALCAVAAAAAILGAHWWIRPDASVAARWIPSVLTIAAGWLIASRDWPVARLAADGSERLVFIAEGAHGITAVTDRAGSRRLKLNNHYALGGTAAVGDERMQAHVPLLLHPAPRRVAFLGLGTAISAGGARFHPVEQLTLVELVPEVVRAARNHFREANEAVLDAANSRVVLADARHFLRHTDERFDVIVGDLVVPWRPGEGALFTREHFVAARDALAADGLYCQWFPLFQLTEEQFHVLTRTFLEVFPRAWVFRGDFSPQQPALALIASRDGRFSPDAAVVRRRLEAMRPDPANPQLRQAELFWLGCVGVLERADLAARESRLNTEDRPWVELLGAAHDGRDPRTAPFVGRALQTWMENAHHRTAPHLATLPSDELAAFRAGPPLGEMTLQLQLGNQAAVREAQTRLQRTLPAKAYQALFESR